MDHRHTYMKSDTPRPLNIPPDEKNLPDGEQIESSSRFSGWKEQWGHFWRRIKKYSKFWHYFPANEESYDDDEDYTEDFSETVTKVIEKVNEIMEDEEIRHDFEFFFSPVTEPEGELIFTVTDPISGHEYDLKSWQEDVESGEPSGYDARDMSQLLSTLDRFQQLHLENSRIKVEKNEFKKQFLDFFEDEEIYIIAIETPPVEEKQIDIRLSPKELEVKAGKNYHKVFHIEPLVDLRSAEAIYNPGLLEVKFDKIINPPKVKVPIKKLKSE